MPLCSLAICRTETNLSLSGCLLRSSCTKKKKKTGPAVPPGGGERVLMICSPIFRFPHQPCPAPPPHFFFYIYSNPFLIPPCVCVISASLRSMGFLSTLRFPPGPPHPGDNGVAAVFLFCFMSKTSPPPPLILFSSSGCWRNFWFRLCLLATGFCTTRDALLHRRGFGGGIVGLLGLHCSGSSYSGAWVGIMGFLLPVLQWVVALVMDDSWVWIHG